MDPRFHLAHVVAIPTNQHGTEYLEVREDGSVHSTTNINLAYRYPSESEAEIAADRYNETITDEKSFRASVVPVSCFTEEE